MIIEDKEMEDKEMNSKRVIAGSLVACLMVTAFAGCGNKDKKEENKVDNVSNTTEEKKETDIENKKSKYDGKILISDRLDEVYKHLELTDANKHLGDVIDFARSPVDVSNYPAILHKDQQGASDAFRMLGIADTDLSEFAIGMTPMTDRAYSVMVLKPADGKEEVVRAGLDKLKEDTDKLFIEKLPDQSEVAKSSVISNIGDYIVFVMCNDYSEVSTSIENALTNQNELNQYIDVNAESFVVIGDEGKEHIGGEPKEEPKGAETEIKEEDIQSTEIGGIEVNGDTDIDTVDNAEAPSDIVNESSSNDTSTDWQ